MVEKRMKGYFHGVGSVDRWELEGGRPENTAKKKRTIVRGSRRVGNPEMNGGKGNSKTQNW